MPTSLDEVINRYFKHGVLVLLTALLVVHVLILMRMPEKLPSVGSLRNATTPEQRRQLLLRKPVVQVDGSVEVDGSVVVTDVQTPVEVTIVR